MAVIDNFMDYAESPLTDPDQPCSSSYVPTPINISTEVPIPVNVSTEVATPINISTEGPKTKKTKVAKNNNVTIITTGSRLPEPCPLPILSERTKEIISGGIKGNKRFFLLREAVIFYEGICPNPTTNEYATMAKTLCHKYPELKDKQDKYWVSVHACI